MKRFYASKVHNGLYVMFEEKNGRYEGWIAQAPVSYGRRLGDSIFSYDLSDWKDVTPAVGEIWCYKKTSELNIITSFDICWVILEYVDEVGQPAGYANSVCPGLFLACWDRVEGVITDDESYTDGFRSGCSGLRWL